MNLKRYQIHVGEDDKGERTKIEKSVSKVLAAYPDYVLAEMDEKQANSLKRKGLELVEENSGQMVKLRSVEFNTSEETPSLPHALSLTREVIEKAEKSYWIVQFVGPIKAEWTDKIKGLGGILGDYVPDNSLLIGMSSEIEKKVAKLPFVNWVGPYEPAYKVSPLLMGRKAKASPRELATLSLNVSAFKPSPEGNLNIILHDPSDLKKVSKEIKSLGGAIVDTGKNKIRASLDLSVADKIAKNPAVKWIEPYGVPELSNDVAAGIMGVQEVWDGHGLDGEGQIVSVADSGLDTGVNDATMHDDFEGRIVSIYDRVGDGASDVNSGHGTHVAGSVLGNGTRSNGSIRGMAYSARLVFQAIERNSTGRIAGIPADLNVLFQQAYDDGARIHTNSWGTTHDNSGNSVQGQYSGDSQDIDEFMWNHRDSVILFSVSNTGRDDNADGVIDADSLSIESSAKNCISVGGTENDRAAGGLNPGGFCTTYGSCFNDDDNHNVPFPSNPLKDDRISNNPQGMVAFSSRGPTDDGRLKPDVVAPGTNILSVRSSRAAGEGWGLLPAGDPNRAFYMYMGGTSMSTPLTAGTVALIRQYLQKACLHAGPSGALLKAILIHGATPITGQYTPSEVGAIPDNNQGWGRVNLRNSLFPDYPAKIEFRDDPAHALGTGEHRDYVFQVANSGARFRATLVWTDFPSDPAVGGGLVNSLRLSVIRPDGTTVQGAPANNNVQQVSIDSPATGSYTVRVRGVNVVTQATTGRKQEFALVVGGGLDFVDVYIKDNADDDGVPPSKGCLCQSPDIWICLSNDPTATPAANPEHGQTNFVFVRVRNRGSRAANNAQVRLYWAKGGTNLSRPYWMIQDIKVNGAAGNVRSVNVPSHGPSGDGEAITEAFEWSPPDPQSYNIEPEHFCLFATVDHPDDPILQEDVDVVRWEDNLAWKNVTVAEAYPDASTAMEFYVAGIKGAASIADLHIDRSGLPSDGNVTLKIPSRYLSDSVVMNLNKIWESEGGIVCQVEVASDKTADIRGISLKPSENTLVRLEVTLPKDAVDGELYPVFVEQKVNGTTTGRVTLLARTVRTPAYIANRSSREIHLANCGWVSKMSNRNKVPYNDLNLALGRGYNGCRFCLPEHDTG
ncbi:MAG TPA: S8 family serine peptidase [Methanothrix sp.]|nr:S8 family serine peptidase [Methanothrix sp.]